MKHKILETIADTSFEYPSFGRNDYDLDFHLQLGNAAT
jgi:hypothetical protein